MHITSGSFAVRLCWIHETKDLSSKLAWQGKHTLSMTDAEELLILTAVMLGA